MEPQNIPNSQNNLEKEKQSWRYHNVRFQAILQSCSNPDSMVLPPKQTHRSIEQNRNKPTIIWSINLRQKRQEYAMGKRQSLQQMVWETIYMQKNESGSVSYTIHKINSKWITVLNVRPETIKILEESTGSNFSDISLSNIFLDMSPEARKIKAKINIGITTK